MSNKNKYYDPNKSHHTVDGFCNTEPLIINKQDVRKWMRDRRQQKLPHPPANGYASFVQQWWQQADFSTQEERIWWLGHATTLVHLQGINILTDPVFSARVSPVSFAGPKRFTPPGTRIDLLPQIDVITISHNHYDHLDYSSIRKLIARFPQVTILVPFGLKRKLVSWGAKQVIELDWWQQATIADIRFSLTPARHWCQRTLWDKNSALWGGWIMQSSDKTVYFMGDTGYSPSLAEIAQRFGPIDMAAIPIGAYAPRWFMQSQHIDPAQAVQLFKELNCKRALAIHWGAFELADEPLDEPPVLLEQALQENHIDSDLFSVIKIGSYLSF